MPLNPSRLYTNDERTACKLRCPECHARLALTWRRARRPGRSDDVFTIAKSSCPNRCEFQVHEVG